MLNSTQILGVKITTNSEDEILEYILSELGKPLQKRQQIIIFTPNPEQIVAAQKDPELKSLLNKADIALPDGIGVVAAAKLLGLPVKSRIAGADFMRRLASAVSERPVTTGYFGGQEGVAVEAANCLQKSYKKLIIGYASATYNKEKLKAGRVDVLFVGLGFPKQEKWIMSQRHEIDATIIMAVGGSLDFLSGRILRAPKVVQDLGAEWLFRLIRQPWRAGRQARLLNFGGLILGRWVSDHLKTGKNNNS